MKKYVLFVILTMSVSVFGQTRRPSANRVKRTSVNHPIKKVDKNTLLRDSLIQENSEFYKLLYTKPIREIKVDNSGLTYKLMSVRDAKDKRGGIAVNLIIENKEQDDSVLFQCTKDDYTYLPYIPILNNNWDYRIYCGKLLIDSNNFFYIQKGIKYSFKIIFRTSQSPEKLTLLRIPEGSHTNSFIDITDVKIDWEGDGEDVLYNTDNISIDSLKKDNEEYRLKLGLNNNQTTLTENDIEYKIINATGRILDDWEYDDLRIRRLPTKKMEISITISITNKGSFKKISICRPLVNHNTIKTPLIVLSNGDIIDNNITEATKSDEGESIVNCIYRLNSNSTRNINFKFSSKGGSKYRIIQLLQLYEENSGKVLVFKNIPINWK